MPYDGFLGSADTVDVIDALLSDPGSGVDTPAAFILETVQGEGGLHAASSGWLRRLAALAERKGILLIVDDVQAGCGRTGSFFSFEFADLRPDIVCLSKSISGYGLPMALVLVRPELDCLLPGEHSGTFRGNNLAFVGATAALGMWSDPAFERGLAVTSELLARRLDEMIDQLPSGSCQPRGRGLFRGLAFSEPGMASRVSRTAFDLGLLVETSGAAEDVIKIMPPIVIEKKDLVDGLTLLESSIVDSMRLSREDNNKTREEPVGDRGTINPRRINRPRTSTPAG
jgi:diaminobutyrate-2-oxoglutarate transaminase